MLFLVAAMAIADIPPTARHDADCVEATSWALSWMGEDGPDHAVENVRLVSYFFLGRLSVRDDKIDWVMSISRDMNVNKKPSEDVYSSRLSECLDELGKQMLTPATQNSLQRLKLVPPHH
jgi:hypothetical protein